MEVEGCGYEGRKGLLKKQENSRNRSQPVSGSRSNTGSWTRSGCSRKLTACPTRNNRKIRLGERVEGGNRGGKKSHQEENREPS